MSRYVRKKHGIIIGSSNTFFYRDENNEMQYFPCIFTLSSYTFSQVNSLNVHIRTPAQQLLWEIKDMDITISSKEIEDQFGAGLKSTMSYPDITGFARRWLDKYAEGWGLQLPEHRKISECPIFLKKRSHAIELYKMIDHHLSGIKIK